MSIFNSYRTSRNIIFSIVSRYFGSKATKLLMSIVRERAIYSYLYKKGNDYRLRPITMLGNYIIAALLYVPAPNTNPTPNIKFAPITSLYPPQLCLISIKILKNKSLRHALLLEAKKGLISRV